MAQNPRILTPEFPGRTLPFSLSRACAYVSWSLSYLQKDGVAAVSRFSQHLPEGHRTVPTTVLPLPCFRIWRRFRGVGRCQHLRLQAVRSQGQLIGRVPLMSRLWACRIIPLLPFISRDLRVPSVLTRLIHEDLLLDVFLYQRSQDCSNRPASCSAWRGHYLIYRIYHVIFDSTLTFVTTFGNSDQPDDVELWDLQQEVVQGSLHFLSPQGFYGLCT